jgi:hypothetical protein
VVVARALARDSLERYGSVAELCGSARRALLDELAAPAVSLNGPAASSPDEPGTDGGTGLRFDDYDDEAFALAAAPATPPADPRTDGDSRLRFDDDDAAFEVAAAPAPFEWEQYPYGRFPRPRLVAAAIVSGLLLGAGAGLLLGGADEPEPALVEHLSSNGMSMTLPPGWKGGVDDGVALSAYPSADGFSGLTVTLDDGDIPAEQRTDPVRLGRLDAWRDTSEAPALVRYVAPTSAGKLVIACEASPAAGRITLRLCERAASTLRLGTISALPLPGVVEEPGVRAAVGRLSAARAAGRRRLARARRPGGQREGAAALARAHERGARKLAGLPEAEPIATAAREAAGAYRALARAAGSASRRRWNAARRTVHRKDARLAEALAARS